jgi:hypothetical protein
MASHPVQSSLESSPSVDRLYQQRPLIARHGAVRGDFGENKMTEELNKTMMKIKNN